MKSQELEPTTRPNIPLFYEPQNPSIDDSELHKTRRTTCFETLKL